MTKDKSCSFSGHRALPKEKRDEIYELTREQVEALAKEGYTDFYTGGASGYDSLAARAVLQMKWVYPNIKLHMYLPYKLNNNGMVREYSFMHNADSIEYSADIYRSRDCLLERNRKLVESSSVMVCCLLHAGAGTAYTVRYAREKGLRIINIADKLS